MVRTASCSLTVEQAAYIAGFVDGEGCIGFNKHKSKSSRRGYIYVGRVTIGNTNFDVMKWIRSAVGFGSLHLVSKKKYGWKDQLLLVWMAQQAKAILPVLMPYLIVRRKQAELVMEFLNMQYIGGLKLGISDEHWAKREVIVEKCALLNQRGRLGSQEVFIK